MKRGFILFLEIMVLVIFLRSSFAQYFLNDIQQTVGNWFYEISTYQDRHALSGLREGIEPFTSDMSEQQRNYLNEVTESRENLQRFNTMYCVGNDKNPFVYGTTLRVLCGQIQQSSLMGKST